jgi:hypothetical protein
VLAGIQCTVAGLTAACSGRALQWSCVFFVRQACVERGARGGFMLAMGLFGFSCAHQIAACCLIPSWWRAALRSG